MSRKKRRHHTKAEAVTAAAGGFRVHKAALWIAVVGLAVYWNSLNGEFIWDDHYLVNNNPAIRPGVSVSALFTSDIASESVSRSNFYRPLQMLSYKIDYAFWRLDPRAYHAHGMALHIAAAFALYAFLFALFRNSVAALWAGLLFVVHPVHTEAVSYISGRADPMAAFFMLFCACAYVRQLESPKVWRVPVMVLSFAAALLSKESALFLPFLLLLIHMVPGRAFRAGAFLPVAFTAIFYLVLRLVILSGGVAATLDGVHATTLLQRLPGCGVAFFRYLKMLIWPAGLHMEYGRPLFSWVDVRVWLGALAVCGCVYAVIRCRSRRPAVAFGLAWFLAALLPVSNLYPLNAFMAEHWLYVPSMGIFLIAGLVLANGFGDLRNKFLYLAAAVAALLALSVMTVQQNAVWQSGELFFERTLRHAPSDERGWNQLGLVYKEKKKFKKAVDAFEKAIALQPQKVDAYNNLANVYAEAGKKNEAAAVFLRAIKTHPKNAVLLINLAVIYNDTQKPEEAAALCRKAIALDPRNAFAYSNLGISQFTRGKKEDAIVSFRESVRLRPGYATGHANLCLMYNDLERYEEAAAAGREAVRIDPSYVKARMSLADALWRLGNTGEAKGHFEKVLRQDTGAARAYHGLAAIYLKEGDVGKAQDYYRKARALGFRDETLEQALAGR